MLCLKLMEHAAVARVVASMLTSRRPRKYVVGGNQAEIKRRHHSRRVSLIVSEELMTSAEIKTLVVQSAKYDAEVILRKWELD